ncbi:MAG: hypothetical protein NTY12_01265 [Candidatus Falkowbacteria bacterium]|nr:hypothetical protein [Candidatus Falkowbacteria bacterium]
MDKKFIMLGMIVGSVIGSYAPTFFGVSAFSLTSIISGAIGGILGIWLSYKFLN